MSVTVNLTDIYSLPGVARSDSPGWQNIFRTKAAKVTAEALTLLGVSVGLFSLFLGLSVL